MLIETVHQQLEQTPSPSPNRLRDWTERLRGGGVLSVPETVDMMRLLMEGLGSEQERLDLLRELRPEQASGSMLAAAAAVLRLRCAQIKHSYRVTCDCCGTGGDRLGLFNISTMVGLALASYGIAMAKHGNRAITSGCGSADLLERLGIPIDLAVEQASQYFAEHRFVFLFAPQYHRATAQVQPLRMRLKQEGIPTFFNLLGPLSNPVQPSHQLIGVFHGRFTEPMAQALRELGCEQAWVVSGQTADGQWMDEISPVGISRITTVNQEGIRSLELSPESFGLEPVDLDSLRGGDAAHNSTIAEQVVRGEDSPYLRAVALNTAAAIAICESSSNANQDHRDYRQEYEIAAELLRSGRVQRHLAKMRGPSEQATN